MAQEMVERALELDPDFALAWGLLAWTHMVDARFGWGDSSAVSVEDGIEAALKGLAIDQYQSDARAILGTLRALQRRYEEADEAGCRAIELSPNSADNYVVYATTLNLMGRAEDAVNSIQKAMRLCPFYPDFYLGVMAQSYRILGRFGEAIELDKERLARNPQNAFSDIRLAAVYSELGREEEARFHVGEALRKNRSCTLAQVRETDPYQDENEMNRYLELLRRVGLPE